MLIFLYSSFFFCYRKIENNTHIPIISEEISLPNIKIINAKNIKYAISYNNGITNYYSYDKKLLLRTYNADGKIIRYQNFDKDNNFYVYDENQNLIVYSKGLSVYDENNHLLYKSKANSKPNVKLNKTDKTIIKKRIKLWKKLNTTKSDLYKSIYPIINKNFDKHSTEVMAQALESYFEDLSKTDPKLYKYWFDNVRKGNFTLNIGKIDNDYIFSINGITIQGLNETKASMAETLNEFHGGCAEVALKTYIGNKLNGQYFYDIKIKKKEGKIKCYPHPPCSACSANISLWSWKIPSFPL